MKSAKEIIETFWKIQDEGDYTKVVDLFSNDAILVDPFFGTFEGKIEIAGFMKKMNEAYKKDPKDKTAQRVIRLFAGQDFVHVKEMYLMRKFREAFNEALSFSIETKREVICFDLVIFAR